MDDGKFVNKCYVYKYPVKSVKLYCHDAKVILLWKRAVDWI